MHNEKTGYKYIFKPTTPPDGETKQNEMKKQIITIAQDLEKGTITEKEAKSLLLGLFSVKPCDFKKIKVGDYIKCIKVYAQSKKYTVGKTYQIERERASEWGGEVALRDDHNKLTWISKKNGVSYTEFALVSS